MNILHTYGWCTGVDFQLSSVGQWVHFDSTQVSCPHLCFLTGSIQTQVRGRRLLREGDHVRFRAVVKDVVGCTAGDGFVFCFLFFFSFVVLAYRTL